MASDRLVEIERRWAIRPEWVRDAQEWDPEIEWLIAEVKRLRELMRDLITCDDHLYAQRVAREALSD